MQLGTIWPLTVFIVSRVMIIFILVNRYGSLLSRWGDMMMTSLTEEMEQKNLMQQRKHPSLCTGGGYPSGSGERCHPAVRQRMRPVLVRPWPFVHASQPRV